MGSSDGQPRPETGEPITLNIMSFVLCPSHYNESALTVQGPTLISPINDVVVFSKVYSLKHQHDGILCLSRLFLSQCIQKANQGGEIPREVYYYRQHFSNPLVQEIPLHRVPPKTSISWDALWETVCLDSF